MSNSFKEVEQEVHSDIFKELESFEKKVASIRKRTRDADFLDRKLVISDSTEFERHFENLSEAIARLLPYHTFYIEEIKPKLIKEDYEKILNREERIKNIQDSIMNISINSPSFIFNASKYGFVRAIHSSVAMDLDRHKKELSQLQALELAWKYPIDNNNLNFANEKPVFNSSNQINSNQIESNDYLYSNTSSINTNFNATKHYIDVNELIDHDHGREPLCSELPKKEEYSDINT